MVDNAIIMTDNLAERLVVTFEQTTLKFKICEGKRFSAIDLLYVVVFIVTILIILHLETQFDFGRERCCSL
jgi:hypothetical protein